MSLPWVMTHEYNTNNFIAYEIDSNGLHPPVISSIGSTYTDFFAYMRFSPNSNFLASTFSSFTVSGELFKFNTDNGTLYDLISIPLFSGDYGTCFSPNNSKLYFTLGGGDVYQFDISSYNQIDITNSKVQIDTTDNYILGAITNGIDNKMYVATFGELNIGVISSPNNSGTNSNLNLQGVSLNNLNSTLGLADFIQSYFNTSETTPCLDTILNNSVLPELFITNIFTPNNDDLNDVFSIALSGYENIEWKIYNRWGQTVESGKLNVDSDSVVQLWDGRTTSGLKAQDGTYYYIINLITKEEKQEIKKGFITLFN